MEAGKASPNRTWRASRGFTLIELLVVIAVIGLLIALILTAISRSKKTALVMQCASNQRQLHLAAETYAADERDQYPPARLWVWTHPRDIDNQPVQNWFEPISSDAVKKGVLYSYLDGQDEIYRCPQGAADGLSVYGQELVRTYSQNWSLGPNIDGVWDIDPNGGGFVRTGTPPRWWAPELRASTVRNPSHLVSYGEETLWELPREYIASQLNDGYFMGHEGTNKFGTLDPRDAFGPIHGRSLASPSASGTEGERRALTTGFANAVFADGHVGRVTFAGRYLWRETIFTQTIVLLRDDVPNTGLDFYDEPLAEEEP